MPRCVVKQPNGKYAIWSSIVDHFISYDCTAEEAIAEEVRNSLYSNYPGDLMHDVCQSWLNLHDNGRAWRWAPTWDEAISTIKELHGEEEAAKILEDLDKCES